MRNLSNPIYQKLLRGILDLVVLTFLLEKPHHGYSIISEIRKRYGVYFAASTIYPLLATLEEKGYIKGEWVIKARPQKIYTLTYEGRKLLKEDAQEIRVLIEPLLANSA